MADKPKCLWHSNAPFAPTGYGQQTGLFAPHLNKSFDFAISSFFGLDGAKLRWVDDIPIYPGLGATFGNEAINGHAKAHFKGDLRGGLVVTLMDVWVLDPAVWRHLNTVCWVPVDHQPAPPPVVDFFERSGAVPVAMSKFGVEQLKLDGLDPLYVPHAVDTSQFKPVDRKEARRLLGLSEDAFVVGVVAANKGQPSRKSFQEILQAFKAFRDTHNDAVLYLHTDVQGRNNGVRLTDMIRSLGIPGEALAVSDQYRLEFDPLPPKLLAAVYSGMDVFLNPSRGEGFGIPILEAQACGVPVIVSDFSAMKELCFAGWKVECDPEWTPQMSWQVRPRVDDIVDALRQCYGLPEATRRSLSEKAVANAQEYDVHKVLRDHMLPALEKAQGRFEERAPVDVVARARAKHQHKKKVAA